MSKTAFIGLGNMGLPMAKNLVAAGHDVTGFDLSDDAKAGLQECGGKVADTIAAAVADADIIFSMLPAGKHVTAVYTESDGVIANAPSGAFTEASRVHHYLALHYVSAARNDLAAYHFALAWAHDPRGELLSAWSNARENMRLLDLGLPEDLQISWFLQLPAPREARVQLSWFDEEVRPYSGVSFQRVPRIPQPQ